MVRDKVISDAVDIPEPALMDEPFATIEIDLSQLTPADALAIAQEVGIHRLHEEDQWVVGAVMAGDTDAEFRHPIEVHLDAEHTIAMLQQLGLVDGGGDAGVEPEDPEAELEEMVGDGEDDG